MFRKKTNAYDQGREDAAQDLIKKMTELSLMNKRFAQALIDAVRGQ